MRSSMTFPLLIGMLLASALVLPACRSPLAPTLSALYDESAEPSPLAFQWSRTTEAYLVQLRTEFGLEDLVATALSDLERTKAICAWVHGLWVHHPSNRPEKSDPLYILRQVKNGQRYRCVEYGIVVAGCLNALGVPARTLHLMTKDVETRESGAGHVASEVYLRDEGKWILVDGQFGVIPLQGTRPLSAVELKSGLAAGAPDLGLWESQAGEGADYFDWISDYLYFLTIPFDNRIADAITDRDPGQLMLVPLGDNKPEIFQQYGHIAESVVATNSVRQFYLAPILP